MYSLFALSAVAAAVQAAPPREDWPRLPTCASATAPVEQPCTVPARFSPAWLAAMTRGRERIWWLVGDHLSVVARPPAGQPTLLCCTFQTGLEPVPGTDLAAVTVRIPRMTEALFDVGIMIGNRVEPPPQVVRGSGAPPAPPQSMPLAGRIEEASIRSAALGEERRIVVYLPPDLRPDERLPVVYLADGGTAVYAPLAEAAARHRRAGRAIIVGIESAQGAIPDCGRDRCERRILEYMSDYAEPGSGESTPFGSHMAFVAGELVPFVERNYPASPRREDRIVAGHSAGAAWAFGAAEHRPDLFGAVLAMSSRSRAAVRDAHRLRGARVYAGAGTFDDGFIAPTRDSVAAATAAGADGRFREVVGGHSRLVWEVLFTEGLAWLVPPGRQH